MRNTRTPALKEILRKIQFGLSGSWRRASRRPLGTGGFLDTDYFKDRVKKLLPRDRLSTRLQDRSDLPRAVVESLGAASTIGDALDLSIPSFMARTRLSLEETLEIRRRLLGLPSPIRQNESPSAR
jgi:hypothetical protein